MKETKILSSFKDGKLVINAPYKDKPIIFAFHGYANLIHELTYRRTNTNLHVRGYKEEGTITTPFDMRVLNEVDRFNLVLLALKHLPKYQDKSIYCAEYCNNMLVTHRNYIKEHGKDMPEILEWTCKKSIAKTKKDA